MARAEFPHRHAFYEIILVTAGRGVHAIDLGEYVLRPPQLFFVAPGQVHHWRRAEGLAGRVLVFGDEALLGYPGDQQLLLSTAAAVQLRAVDARRVGGILNDLAREYAERAPGFESVLPALLHVLIVHAHRLGAGGRGTPGNPLAAQFARLLAGGGIEPSVAAYARRLGTEPGRLIRRAQSLEARRLLARTDLSVAQVGRASGFADPAYFSRFFRREVGVTPGQYREKHHRPHGKSIDGDGCSS